MPKAPRDDKGSSTPKKRTRKATSTNGNGVHAENGNGALPHSVATSPEIASDIQVAPKNTQITAKTIQAAPNVDEQIRIRAYELYLQRAGNGGSPEQDWLRAKQEICGQ
jgi:hypothetical protein